MSVERTIRERAVRALQRTWNAIASDVLACDDRRELDAEDVREAVSNAGFTGGYPGTYGDDAEAVKWLAQQDRADQDGILAEAFPNGLYG